MKNILVASFIMMCFTGFGQLKVTTNGRIAAINTTSNPRAFFDIQQNNLTVPLGQFGMFGIQSLNNTNGFLCGNGAWRGGSIGYELYNNGYGGLVQFATNRIMFRQTPQGVQGDTYVNNALINTMTLRDNSAIINAPTSGTLAPYNLTVYGTAGKNDGSSDWTVFSDRRLKKNIKTFDGGLKEILALNPVYFDYTGKANTTTGKTYVGLIAQEAQKVAPYLVSPIEVLENEVIDEETFEVKSATTTEYLSMDNTAVRYMLVNAVQEQQQIIDSQNDRIIQLEEAVEALIEARANTTTATTNVTLEHYETGAVNQNVPNPFNGVTTIEYVVPNKSTSAAIQFFNTNGQLIKAISIDHKGAGNLNLNAEDLPSGTYSYSLLIDNKLIDTKRMILTK